jgi:MFS family permease
MSERPVLSYETSLRPASQRLWVLYAIEGCTSVGINLIQVGIFFYMFHRFGWGLAENLLLATGQGVSYVSGALAAAQVSRRLGRRKALVVLYLLMTAVMVAAMAVESAGVLAVILLLHTVLNGMNWPALESLVSSGVDAQTLSRRLAIYNVVWSGTGAAVIAVTGTIIAYYPAGFFLLAVVVHGLSSALLLANYRSVIPPAASHEHAHVEPEPELLHKRGLALWLSRISLPSSYMVNYSIMAMMPLLPVIQQLEAEFQTVVASVWLMARWASFGLLGWSTWWHTRPRALLVAAGVMLVAFLGVTVQASLLVPGVPYGFELLWMIGWQVAMGMALGLIYTGSLYFGMVLSEGSTEHGGYHEALIGLGSVLGPGSGFLAQTVGPGGVYAGVFAVASVLGVSLIVAMTASRVLGRRGGERGL